MCILDASRLVKAIAHGFRTFKYNIHLHLSIFKKVKVLRFTTEKRKHSRQHNYLSLESSKQIDLVKIIFDYMEIHEN